LLAAFVLPVTSYAGVAWEFDQVGSYYYTVGSFAFGNKFTVGNSNVIVSSLGYYDDFGNGFIDSHEVGIYELVGNTLLTSTMVDNSSALVGHFRYTSIKPLVLSAGTQYEVVGVSHGDKYAFNNVNFTVNPLIAYNGNYYSSGTSLTNAVTYSNDVTDGFWGPNMMLETAAPEPGTVSLIGIGLAGLAFSARRRINR
jgi:hypothetical protein